MNLYFIGRGIVLKGIVKYYGSGKNIPRTFGHTDFLPQALSFSPSGIKIFSLRHIQKR
jgi:hypothetical protein